MRCKEEVKHREAYIYIPLKMVISTGKAIIHPVVGRIIRENKQVFYEEENADWEQMTLCLFIFYEMTLGRKSYWYPYLRLMPEV